MLGMANWDDILCIRLQGWLLVILVGESAVLLTDAKSGDSHQEARLILFRTWPGALARLRLSERATPKRNTMPVVMMLTGRWEHKERVVNCCSISCDSWTQVLPDHSGYRGA